MWFLALLLSKLFAILSFLLSKLSCDPSHWMVLFPISFPNCLLFPSLLLLVIPPVIFRTVCSAFLCETLSIKIHKCLERSSVADPHQSDPDPACHIDADSDPKPSFQIKAQYLEKVPKKAYIFHTFWFVTCKLMRIWIRIQVITLMRMRILSFNLRRVQSRSLPFNLIRIRIQIRNTGERNTYEQICSSLYDSFNKTELVVPLLCSTENSRLFYITGWRICCPILTQINRLYSILAL